MFCARVDWGEAGSDSDVPVTVTPHSLPLQIRVGRGEEEESSGTTDTDGANDEAGMRAVSRARAARGHDRVAMGVVSEVDR